MALLVYKFSDEDYLDEDYSNTEILHEEPDSDAIAIEVVETTPTAPAVQVLDEERQGLHDFVERILKQVLKREDCSIQVFYSRDAQPLFVSYGITFLHEYLVTVEADGIGASCQILSQICKHDHSRLGILCIETIHFATFKSHLVSYIQRPFVVKFL